MIPYLDIEKSVIISSPAGSGKTEKLARRYISLLEGEGAVPPSEVEKILCITFTEKAAAEMKERILGILRAENGELFNKVRAKIPLMRISTIHAFCLRLLRRFSVELGVDPNLTVMEELEARSLWVESVYEILKNAGDAYKKGSGSYDPFLLGGGRSPLADPFAEAIKGRGLRGWNSVRRLLDELHAVRFFIENGAHIGGESDVADIYGQCLSIYKKKKAERRLLDFDDLEILAYRALSRGPEWLNILYCFDERTDHILVDEFQDTSTLQWKIIEKLTEEWRSGAGAKREAGKTPTIFLVGDEKQSIYLFRGANVGIFEEAKRNFSEWLGREYHFVEAKENYRSLPAIVDFANLLFGKLIGNYSPFEAVREGEGRVELILSGGAERTEAAPQPLTREKREGEARALAMRIKSLAGRHMVYEGGAKRPCMFGDMAILLRRRTHLGIFEDELRREGIPFIVLKGVGFYEEPETALLRELVSFLTDPLDDYSLFCVLRSPLFSVGYKTLHGLLKGDEPLFKRLAASDKHRDAYGRLASWIERGRSVPLAELLEQALLESGGWAHFHEEQRRANIGKFISLIESFEAAGLSPIEIREKLIRHRRDDVPKANVNAEGMNAVRIMTVHAAKGLQFPMVFLPSLDESIGPKSGPVAVEESRDSSKGDAIISCEDDSDKRAKNEIFIRRKEKELEEEKRLFYVAATRARDFLCMGAQPPFSKTSRLSYLNSAFGLLDEEGKLASKKFPFEILSGEDIEKEYASASGRFLEMEGGVAPFMEEPVYSEPLSYNPDRIWRDVTEGDGGGASEGALEGEYAGEGHGGDWIAAGRVLHRVFEELSKGIIGVEEISGRAEALLRAEGAEGEILGTIMRDIEKLKESGHMDIILPRPGSYAELPFVHERGGSVFRGRIDRLIIEGDAALIYDYKTFPVRAGEMAGLMEKYGFQMELYREAAAKLFSLKTRAYLLFTHLPEVVEV